MKARPRTANVRISALEAQWLLVALAALADTLDPAELQRLAQRIKEATA